MIKELARLKHTDSSSRLNYLLIPVSTFDITPKGARDFNKIYLLDNRLTNTAIIEDT